MLPSAHSLCEDCARKEVLVRSDMLKVTVQLFASIGCGVSARKAMTANFFMNTTCQRCLNATFSPNSVSAATKNVHFYTLTQRKKIKDCPWYDRGFCRHGPNCKNRHVRRVICQSYLNGFCCDGPNCKFMHPKFELPTSDPATQAKKASIVCHYCAEIGHKAANCQKIPPEMKMEQQQQAFDKMRNQQIAQIQVDQSISADGRRPLDQVTCFKCGEKGHYANKCPKGHLAFLSNTAIV